MDEQKAFKMKIQEFRATQPLIVSFKQLNFPFSIAVVGEEKRDTFSLTELQSKSPH